MGLTFALRINEMRLILLFSFMQSTVEGFTHICNVLILWRETPHRRYPAPRGPLVSIQGTNGQAHAISADLSHSN